MLTSMQERELHVPDEQPLIGWRLFRVRRSESGLVLSAPLIHNPDFERFPAKAIDAVCYQADHPAPAPGCRCGLYAAIDGTLDSLSGYLSDSAHDRDPPVYAEVACTGRVFVDARGVRAGRIEILRLATPASLWPGAALPAQAVAELGERYGVEVYGHGVVPQWVLANVMRQRATRGRRHRPRRACGKPWSAVTALPVTPAAGLTSTHRRAGSPLRPPLRRRDARSRRFPVR